MKKLISWFVDNFDKIYIVALFVISFVIVVYLFPGEGKFRYEFQKGQPWQHKDLIAPFDFAIYKMKDELANEKKEILQTFTPYFVVKTEAGKQKLKEFENEFSIKLSELRGQQDSLQNSEASRKAKVLNYDSLSTYYNIAKASLTDIYKKGVLEQYYDADELGSNWEFITVVRNKVAEQYDYNSFYTLKSAYKYVVDKLTNSKNQSYSNYYIEFIKSLQIDKYIVPTLFYDYATTEKAKKEITNGISLTKGMVQGGERVISRGEMVDSDKFRILESLKREYINSLHTRTNMWLMLVGRVILVAMIFIILLLFFSKFEVELIKSRKNTFLVLSLVVLFVFISKIIYNLNLLSIYLIPYAIVPILINTFLNSRSALFSYIITILLSAFYAPNGFEFILIELVSGIVSIMALRNIQKRGDFFGATGLTILSYFLLYFGISIIQEGNIESIDWINFAWFAGNGVLLLLSFPLIYFVEKTFGFLSDITLMELSDTNQNLLRNMAENAPGTFQHSMQVANLAEEVIRNIGGNPLLVRTGALYHDIGKLANQEYFTENQISGKNPHDDLDYKKSAEIIINHRIDGEEMAKKEKLPEKIIDFIKTHHGTTKVQYFYRLYKKENPDTEDEAAFTYPGPKPFSKETAVLMMSDSIEAASRSLKEYSPETINNLVEGIINYQIKEKQFDDANINFAEISKAKAIFKSKLQNIYHARIEYPKEEE